MAQDRFQTLIFDLDDTLIPTSEVLIPRAVRHVFEILAKQGLEWDFETFEAYRRKHMARSSHREIIKNIITENSLSLKSHILESCLKAFYQIELPAQLPLLPGAKENLQTLQPKYNLFLLTGGNPQTQREKLQRAQLTHFFEEISIVDTSQPETKKQSLETWIEKKLLIPERTLSIGNRLKDEIQLSKSLGLKTCWIKFGEHADEVPENERERADYEIYTHAELIEKCRL